jgi:hypothetical protein
VCQLALPKAQVELTELEARAEIARVILTEGPVRPHRAVKLTALDRPLGLV